MLDILTSNVERRTSNHTMFYQIFLLGFYTAVTQILLLREVLSTFSGNELSAGIVLFSWLLGSGMGNFFSKKYIDRYNSGVNRLFFINLIFFIFLFLLNRRVKLILHMTSGEIIGFGPLFLFSSLFISSFCVIWGISFGSLYDQLRSKLNISFSESKLYYIEASGAALGSLVTTFFFVAISPFLTMGFLFILLSISFFLEIRKVTIPFVLSFLFALLLIFFQNHLNVESEKWRVGDFNIKAIVESYYGKIVVIQTGKGYSFFNNGVFLFSTDDDIAPQLESSLPLSQSDGMKRVLLIGGTSKTIAMMAENPMLEKIFFIDFDPALIKLQKVFIKTNYFKHPKVMVFTGDARYFMQRTRLKFDAVILSLPDPVNLQINRFYTKEFFQMVKQKLNREGLFMFRITSSENFISPVQGMYTGSLFNTVKKIFKDVMVLPGDDNYFLACPADNVLSADPATLERRVLSNDITSEYFKKYYIIFNFDPFRINNLKNSLNRKAKINTDLVPISYYYNITLWSTRFNQITKNIFSRLYHIKKAHVIGCLLVIFLVLFFFIKRKEDAVLLSIGSIGFTEISLEIFAILTYQIVRGFLYHNVGLVIFSFMAGLAIGSFLYQRMKSERESIFTRIQLGFVFIPFLIYLWYRLIQAVPVEFIQDVMFLIAVLAFSILSGIQFPVAVKLYSDNRYSAGRVNGVDLVASSLGAIIVATFIVPLLGLVDLLIILTFINLFTFIILHVKLNPYLLSWRKRRW
ncbi:MAG: hypothetical protein JW827_02230 [Spirochaetes bacterium]|nr:hypothetical protein [Spirochaetota bacterium]